MQFNAIKYKLQTQFTQIELKYKFNAYPLGTQDRSMFTGEEGQRGRQRGDEEEAGGELTNGEEAQFRVGAKASSLPRIEQRRAESKTDSSLPRIGLEEKRVGLTLIRREKSILKKGISVS